MDEENFTKDQILNNLGELIIELIIGTLHHKMMAMSGSRYIISPHEPSGVLDEDSLFEHDQCRSRIMIMMKYILNLCIFHNINYFSNLITRIQLEHD